MFCGLFGEKKVEVKAAEVSGKGVDDGEVVAEVAKSKMTKTLVLGSLFGLCEVEGGCFSRDRPLLLNGNDDEYERSITWLGYLFALGWHLKEIHVAWAHLGKKQTRLKLYTKVDEEIAHRSWRQQQNIKETASGILR
ncbi:hypothetical protein Tco_1091617 [Tanacetum coccineum]|uniref:Uncharacterized protein n=1 Tax=Tanacetum coccineum TaxID=301880 RepID=A0ABQ5I7J5_9ASTR